MEHLRLVCLVCDQSEYLDLTLLPYPVCPRCGLHIVLGIPVRVKDNYNVGTGQVDTNASCLCRQQKYLPVSGGVIVPIYAHLPFLGFGLPINLLVLDAPVLQKILE